MKPGIRLSFALLALVLGLRAAVADDVALSPRRGVLLLNNGQLISGLITAAGDRYDVVLDGGEIHVQRSHVALVARDVAECYVHKRSLVEPGRIQDHLELAEWCLRNGLTEQATREIAAAREIDESHPKLRLLEARLQLAAAPLSNHSGEPIKLADKKAGEEQLDLVARNLPAGAMESFTNNIQPILLNYCSRSGCHGATGETAMRLERIPPNRRAGRKPTQRNLQAALAMVDRAKPDESPLLVAPLKAHGGMKAPVFGEREQAQYRQLVQWVHQLSGAKSSASPTLAERTGALQQQRTPPSGVETAPPAPIEAAGTTPAPEGASSSETDTLDGGASSAAAKNESFRLTRVRGQLELRPLAKSQADAQPFVPKDVFDPAIFNRRYFGE